MTLTDNPKILHRNVTQNPSIWYKLESDYNLYVSLYVNCMLIVCPLSPFQVEPYIFCLKGCDSTFTLLHCSCNRVGDRYSVNRAGLEIGQCEDTDKCGVFKSVKT